MATYMIFVREGEIVDHEAMAAYQGGNREAPPPTSMKPLAVYGAMETFEGEAADGVVILEFPDTQSARDLLLLLNEPIPIAMAMVTTTLP